MVGYAVLIYCVSTIRERTRYSSTFVCRKKKVRVLVGLAFAVPYCCLFLEIALALKKELGDIFLRFIRI